MREIYCIKCKKKYKEFKKPKISYICYKILLLSIARNKCRGKDKELFMEEESIEILESHCLVTNINSIRKYIAMFEENIYQEFRLKKSK